MAVAMPKPVAEAVNHVMTKVKNVEKGGTNQFHNYKYARMEDLLFQVQPAMAEAGLIITQHEVSISTLAGDALMAIQYAFTISHKSGESWLAPIHQTGVSAIRTPKGNLDDKCVNKCHTAARKYFILGLFQIPAGDLPDADNDGDVSDKPQATSQRAAPKPPPPKADPTPIDDEVPFTEPTHAQRAAAEAKTVTDSARKTAAATAEVAKMKADAAAPGPDSWKGRARAQESQGATDALIEALRKLQLSITKRGPDGAEADFVEWRLRAEKVWKRIVGADETRITEAVAQFKAAVENERAAREDGAGHDPETGELKAAAQ